MYTHATRTLAHRDLLVLSGTSPLRGHMGESTDRHLGGNYYLRMVGSSGLGAPLMRIDASDGTSERIATVPDLWACYRAPQMVRAGTIAAYAACDRVEFHDLLPACGDRSVDAGEECDDGDNDDGDGCSAGCTTEPL
jgi:cysteine-rich repeat protein